MGKKKNKKLINKLGKLEKELYNDIKYIPKEEMLLSKLSKPLKAYYNKIPAERQKALLSYIIHMEEIDELEFLSGLKLRDDKDSEIIPPKKCHKLSEVVSDIKKRRKYQHKPRKKFEYMLKRKDGLLVLINPESYDHTLLSNKKYRKYLKKIASKEKESNPILDCTLKNFKDELMNNPKINNAVTEAFYAKYRI